MHKANLVRLRAVQSTDKTFCTAVRLIKGTIVFQLAKTSSRS